MADGVYVRLDGLADLARAIQELRADLRRRVMRAALRDGARIILRAVKADAPVLKKPHPYRIPGTVRNSLTVRTSRLRKAAAGELGVYIKPRFRGLGGRRSSRNPFDPFYYRFLEDGTRKMRARSFIGPAFAAHKDAALALITRRTAERIAKANTRK
jgi:HK97 gp10 family phage protein